MGDDFCKSMNSGCTTCSQQFPPVPGQPRYRCLGNWKGMPGEMVETEEGAGGNATVVGTFSASGG